MTHSDFVHLHVHTQYSLLDGACRISNLIDLACLQKSPALAITDHGNLFGAIEFYQRCLKKGVKPIIGCEVYVAPDSRLKKYYSQAEGGISSHLILLAKDEGGYRNLMKLVSFGYIEGFYYKPRIDKELLGQYGKGLIGLSACLKGEIPGHLLSGRNQEAINAAGAYQDILGKGNFYLELQNNTLPEQKELNPRLISLSKQLDLPLVATNDVHYLAKKNAKAHEALLCIQTQTTLDDPNRIRFRTEEFYFKAPEEMKAVFKDVPGAIRSTIDIAEKCNLELDFEKTYLPQYKPPQGISREEFLKKICQDGLKQRFPQIQPELTQRLNRELDVIFRQGYTSYFLIAWDFVKYAKSKSIPVGPGRGSAAGSLVAYVLGITDVNPLNYGLIFERFLNPERVSMPDIDIDFCYERRSEVIDYVINKYGKDNVAQIITFGTMGAKAVVRDVGRVMGMSYGEVDRIAKLIPNDLNITLHSALEREIELRRLYETQPKIKELIETSMDLEGLSRHASTHAAGVVISEKPLTNYIPLFMPSEGQITTGYPMNTLEKIGLLKMDFLGLRTLTVIDETLKIIKRLKNIDLKIEDIPLDDKKTFVLLCRGETFAVFQLESSGMRDILKKLRPERFEDIIAVLAIYRPGPIGSGMVEDFIKRKRKKVPIKYYDSRLASILSETYGIIIYQEQVMRIASELAGFSLSRADLLRRAMSKKIPEVMEEQRKFFVGGCLKRGVKKYVADKIFDLIEYFAGYGFNKSHSTAYALISYRTAYLKSHYPVEFMTALLTSEKDNTDKIAAYINEAIRMKINILPPDVNESFAKFTTVGSDAIRFGLGAVKNVGQGAIDSIVESRQKQGKFTNFYDFCERIDLRLVNRKVIESLIKCGTFDSFRYRRAQLMAVLPQALEIAGAIQKDRLDGQLSFFDAGEVKPSFKKSFEHVPEIAEWPEYQLLSFEKQMLGFYITGHPLAKYENMLKKYRTHTTGDLANRQQGQRAFIGGVVEKIKYTTTRKNEKMAILTLEDLQGAVRVVVFPRMFNQYFKHISPNALVFVRGNVDFQGEEPQIIADALIPLSEMCEKHTSSIEINIGAGGESGILDSVRSMLLNFSGEVPVFITLYTKEKKKVRLLVDREYFVHPCLELLSEIENSLGKEALSVKTK